MAAAAAIAAAQRNTRRKAKEADKEARRNARRIKKERNGISEGLSVESKQIVGYAKENVNQDPMAQLSSTDSEDSSTSTPSKLALRGPYGRLAHFCKTLSHADSFNGFIIFVILIAGVLVGLQSYPAMEQNTAVSIIDKCVLITFCAECVIKIIAEYSRPWRYFTGSEWKWNVFDFTIVFMSLPIFNWGSSIALLRLVRLMRLIKLVKRIPQLYMIVMGLMGGMRAIMYILVLLLLIFYMYSVVGFYLFAENDPFQFGDIWKAMVTLWRVSTFEDWTDVLYTNYYSCAVYPGNIYIDEVSLDPESYGRAGELWACTNPEAQELLSVLYFISFVFVSSLVMLSLFVGAVTMSMTESMEELNEEKEAVRREQALAKARERALLRSGTDTSLNKSNSEDSPQRIASDVFTLTKRVSMLIKAASRSSLTKITPLVNQNSLDENVLVSETPIKQNTEPSIHSSSKLSAEKYLTASGKVKPMGSSAQLQRAPTMLSRMFSANMSQTETDLFDDAEIHHLRSLILRATGIEDIKRKSKNVEDEAPAHGAIITAYISLAARCEKVVQSSYFVNFITFIIVCAGIQIGVSTFPQTTQAQKLLKVTDGIILGIFALEILLKTIAAGLKPWHFFYFRGANGWNIFDYIVVVGSLIPGSGSTLTILRLLRLLRVLKLLRALPELQIIVVALINGIGSISYIALILFMVFYIFAIAGQILFAENDPLHFGSLHIALITLFRSATLEDWSDLAYISMYGCNQFGYDGFEALCESPKALGAVAALYYILFTLIGGLVLMTLFIGVVTMSMEEASQDQKDRDAVMDRAQRICEASNIPKEIFLLYEEIFNTIDYDGGGSIDEEELAIGFIAIGDVFSKAEIREMVARVDDDNSGELDLAEFIEFMTVFKEEFLQRTDGTGDIRLARNFQKRSQDAVNITASETSVISIENMEEAEGTEL